MAQNMATMAQEIAVKDGRVQQLQCEVEVKGNSYISNTIITHLHTQEKDREIMKKDQEMASKKQEIAVKDGRVQQLQSEVEVKGNSLVSPYLHTYKIIHTQELQLRETRLREELQSKEAENSRLREELRKCPPVQHQQSSTPVHINSEHIPITCQPPPTLSEASFDPLGASILTGTTVCTPGQKASENEGAVGGGGGPVESVQVQRKKAKLPGKKVEVAEELIDPQQLWDNFFSGIIMDDAADAVDDSLNESQVKQGEHRFAGLCKFPIKLIFVPLKQGSRMASTFASLLAMRFGPLHVILQVGEVILEWNQSSLVTPRLCAMEDQIMQLDMQPYSEWVKYTGKQFSMMKSAVEGLDYGQQIELIYKVASEKKRLIDALIAVIIKYNKFHNYSVIFCNCQHFVRDALKALEVKLPREFEGDLGDYYKALVKGKTPSVPSEFKTHTHLDLYILEKRRQGILSSMPQHDLEFFLALYFRFHLESKSRLKADHQALEQWRCEESRCQMEEIEKLIDLHSMQIHTFN